MSTTRRCYVANDSTDVDLFEDCCSDISVIGDMTTVKKKSQGFWSSIYGRKWIILNSIESIIEYQIQINKLTNPHDGLMFIGISSTDEHSTARYSFYNDNKKFSYCSDGIIYHNYKYFNAITNGQYKTNDIIKLRIDPFAEKISFHKNDTLISCEGYNVKSINCYKLAVSLFNKHDSVSIINQENINTNNKLDESTQIISELIQNNNELTCELSLLKRELAMVKQRNCELTCENGSLRKQTNSLNESVLSQQNYVNWNVSQVISWIMSIENGKYLRYYEMLNIKIRDCDLNGEKLKELDYVDIKKQLGIIDVDDRKILYRNIQLLIAKNKTFA